MTIGGSIGLIVLGAILAFAVEVQLAGLDITVVGLIMIAGGVVGLIIGLVLLQRSRTSTVATTTNSVHGDTPADGTVTQQETTRTSGRTDDVV